MGDTLRLPARRGFSIPDRSREGLDGARLSATSSRLASCRSPYLRPPTSTPPARPSDDRRSAARPAEVRQQDAGPPLWRSRHGPPERAHDVSLRPTGERTAQGPAYSFRATEPRGRRQSRRCCSRTGAALRGL